MGWRSASNFRARSSISCCIASMRASPPTALSAAMDVAPGDGFDGGGELRLGQAAHLGDQGGKRFKLFGECLDGVIGHRDSCLSLGPRDRGFPPILCDGFITLP